MRSFRRPQLGILDHEAPFAVRTSDAHIGLTALNAFSPHKHIFVSELRIHTQPYRTVETCPRIPPRTERHIFQTYGYQLSAFDRQLHDERHIARFASADLLAIGIYDRVGHRTIKHKFCFSGVFRKRNKPTIPAFAHPRQPACASCMVAGNTLPVLDDHHMLQIVRTAELAADRPVVRYAHRFPRLAVVGEFPAVKKRHLYLFLYRMCR